MTVHINSIRQIVFEVQIVERDVCLEVLKFLLAGINYGHEVKQATGKWIFYDDDFRSSASKDRYELSQEANAAICEVADHYEYYDADRFIVVVPRTQEDDLYAPFNEYKVSG